MPRLIERLRPYGAMAVAAWAWWIAELAAMLPAALRRPDRVPSADITLFHDRVEIVRIERGERARFVDARPVEALDAEAWDEMARIVEGSRARLLLPSPQSYIATLALPRQARTRLRSAVALQLDTVSPVPATQILWVPRVVASDRTSITTAVAMVKSERVAQLASLFGQHDLPLPGIAAVREARIIDLVPGHDGSRTADWRRNRQAFGAAAALLATIPVSIVALAWIETQGNDSQTAFLRQQAAPRIAAERRLREAEAARTALRPILARRSATKTLDAIARILPDTAYARRTIVSPAGPLTLEVDTSAPDAVEGALVSTGAQLRDQAPAEAGRVRLTWELPR